MSAPHPGYRLADLPIGRTLAYQLLAEGKLHAVKIAGCTLVTNWHDFVASQPSCLVAGKDTSAATAVSLANRRAGR